MSVKNFVVDNLPEILTGVNLASTVGAVILTADATPKAVQIIRAAEIEKGAPLTLVEKTKKTWRQYLPAGVCTAVALGTSIGSNMLSGRHNAELLMALTASERFIQSRAQTMEQKLEAPIVKEIKQEAPLKLIPGDVGVIETGEGQELFYDAWFGRMFRSSEQAVRLAYAKFLEDMSGSVGTFWSYNELYGLVGLNDVGGGNVVGWSPMYRPEMEIEWDSPREVYKVIYFGNPPLTELSLAK